MPLASASESPHADRLLVVIGAVSGACIALSRLASSTGSAGASWLMVLIQAAVAAQGGAALLWVVRAGLRWAVGRFSASHAVRDAYTRNDTPTYAVFLLTLSTAAGVQLVTPVPWTLLALFVAAQASVLRRARPLRTRTPAESQAAAVSALFFVSGVAALIYQVTWQHALLRHFGANMESVTIVVSIFMLGLGLGTLAGGRFARVKPWRLPAIFVALEAGMGLFGLASLPLINRVGDAARASSVFTTTVLSYALLAVPTLLMGATLPVLVAWLHHAFRGVGRSVARLYFANTLGSAVACFLTVDVIFAFTGLRGATRIAASGNFLVALLAFVIASRVRQPTAGVVDG